MKQSDLSNFQNKQKNPILKSWLSSHSSARQSQCSQVMGKVPKQMRNSLQRQKSIKQSIGIKNFYEGFRSVFDPSVSNCSICLEPIRNDCMISDCNHKFCSECLINYMTFKINSMEEIICPDENCDRKIDFMSNGWKILPQEYKQKYKKQQLWRQTIKNPDLKLCPNKKCKDGTIQMRKIPPTCYKCHKIFCQECMMQAHAGKQCDQNFKENFKEWKRCPNCQIFIEKTQGCNHMVCRCKNEFCFVCVEAWNNQHYACVEDRETDLFNAELLNYPKVMAIFMTLVIPILIVFAIALLILAGVALLVGGFFVGVIFTLREMPGFCMICGIILSPIAGIIVALVAFVWGLFFYLIPVFLQYFRSYRRSICVLCNRD